MSVSKECCQRLLLRGPRRVANRTQPPLGLELLEPRLAMDGAGFVNTDPPEDPDSIVGVAGIVASNDFVRAASNTQMLRISPLENDELPEGASELTIRSVGETRRGATVTISEDGRHLLYTPNEENAGRDSFYYIVETGDGRLGKANVEVDVWRPRGPIRVQRPIQLNVTVLEDAAETEIDAFRLNARLGDGGSVITAVTVPSRGGAVRITDDGRSLIYQPEEGESGFERFDVIVRDSEGEEARARVLVRINKPYRINPRGDSASLTTGEEVVLDPLANDSLRGPTPLEPRIESFELPEYAGELTLLEDGRRFRYEPAEGFLGTARFRYTIRYGEADHQVTEGHVSITVLPSVTAVENWFAVSPDVSEPTALDVLANDLVRNSFIDGNNLALGVRIVAVSAGSNGGRITISEDGSRVLYEPADGFRGDETFEYTAEGLGGARSTARVTVHVATPIADPSGVARFATEGELQQYLIDRAVERFRFNLGRFTRGISSINQHQLAGSNNFVVDVDFNLANASLDATHSDTNTQVSGVDEADIVETDGRYLYTFNRGQLAIVDLIDPANPVLVSVTSFEGSYDRMFLQGDRITLLRDGSGRWRSAPDAEVLVLDLGDRTAPTVVERTEINGRIVDSRAIGDRIHLVIHHDFDFPELGSKEVAQPSRDADEQLAFTQRVFRNETIDEYVTRVRDELLEAGFSTFRSYGPDGELVASGLLSSATSVHQPIAGEDLAVSFVTLDAGDDLAGPLAEATTFIADRQAEVYVSTEAAYIFSYDRLTDTTTIHKLNLEPDGSAPLVATGQVRGRLLYQFAADEFDGHLRVATTQTEIEAVSKHRWRQTRVFNNLLVLEQQGNQLVTVGEVTNLAPTETIHAVRYQGERAFVVTFRRVDPLFSIDLSDPTEPTVEGALKIPGFSNYLHPVGDNFLIGVGHDVDEITGRIGQLQITLFNIADLSAPVVADQVTLEGAIHSRSEATLDHRAVSFFTNEEGGVLALPVALTERVDPDNPMNFATQRRTSIFTFDITTGDGAGDGAIMQTGEIEHGSTANGPTAHGRIFTATPGSVFPIQGLSGDALLRTIHPQQPSPVRRAVRVGESLVTVSDRLVRVHDFNDPAQQIGKVYLDPPAVDDRFQILEDSGPNELDVLTNDLPTANGTPSTIVAVTQPTRGGNVAIAADGGSLLFTPSDDFFGSVTFTYSVQDTARGEVEASVTVHVGNVVDAPIVVDDQTAVPVNSDPVTIDVLANDTDPDSRNPFLVSVSPIVLINDLTDLNLRSFNSLRVTEVGSTDQGGSVEIDAEGSLIYQPAEGFEGVETFTYTVENWSGLTSTGLVTVVVGEATSLMLPNSSPNASLQNPSTPPAAELAALLRFVAFSGTLGRSQLAVTPAISSVSSQPVADNLLLPSPRLQGGIDQVVAIDQAITVEGVLTPGDASADDESADQTGFADRPATLAFDAVFGQFSPFPDL